MGRRGMGGGLCSMPFSPHPVRLPPETQPMCEEKGNICEALGFRPWKVLSYSCGTVGNTEAQGRGRDALGREGDGKLIGEASLVTDPACWLPGVLCAGGGQRLWVCRRRGVLHRTGECQVWAPLLLTATRGQHFPHNLQGPGGLGRTAAVQWSSSGP